jgi:hypothetical protein
MCQIGCTRPIHVMNFSGRSKKYFLNRVPFPYEGFLDVAEVSRAQVSLMTPPFKG